MPIRTKITSADVLLLTRTMMSAEAQPRYASAFAYACPLVVGSCSRERRRTACVEAIDKMSSGAICVPTPRPSKNDNVRESFQASDWAHPLSWSMNELNLVAHANLSTLPRERLCLILHLKCRRNARGIKATSSLRPRLSFCMGVSVHIVWL